jgi:hypothetical protein
MEYHAMAACDGASDMARGYLECAEWCGLDDSEREALELSVSPKWSQEAVESANALCESFSESFPECSDDPYQAGMDLWLTRNRHGAGFWDGDWPRRDEMTSAAHIEGSAYVSYDEQTETLYHRD